MDILGKKIVSASEGASTINAQGLNLAQIIEVARQGLQQDYTDFLNLNTMGGREWTYATVFGSKRIYFSPSFPFMANEKIFIIYKTSVV